jgi:hypothetical protein
MSRIETWAFMESELEQFDACHAEDEFVSYLPGEKIGVIVFRNGKASHRYSDGTAGVPEFVRRLAERDAFLYRRRCQIACWRKVVVSEAGWPIRVSKRPCEKGVSLLDRCEVAPLQVAASGTVLRLEVPGAAAISSAS